MEKRGSDISVKERAGLTWDRERERDRVLQSRCLSERTEKVVSVGLARVARGEGRNKESRREKEQTGESRARGGETRNAHVRARWIREGRHQPARRMPLPAAAKF